MIFLRALFSLIINPVTWVEIGLIFLMNSFRIQAERKQFKIAVDSSYQRVHKAFIIGIPIGVILSLATVVIGFCMPENFLLIFEIEAPLLLILAFWRYDAVINWLLILLFVVGLNQVLPTDAKLTRPFGIAVFAVAIVFTLIMSWLLKKNHGRSRSPQIYEGKRGRLMAAYRLQQFYFVPIIFLLPGKFMINLFQGWPLVSIGQTHFRLFWFPIILGFSNLVKHQIPTDAINAQSKDHLHIALGLLLPLILEGIFPHLLLAWIAVALVITTFFLLQQHRRNTKGATHLTEPTTGIMVLDTIADTPAQKMGLEIGDTIVECNHEPVNDETELYRAIQKNGAYCHLRVITLNNEIKLTETAIYLNAPHELGIITFPKEKTAK